jgi:hypothetical protein
MVHGLLTVVIVNCLAGSRLDNGYGRSSGHDRIRYGQEIHGHERNHQYNPGPKRWPKNCRGAQKAHSR